MQEFSDSLPVELEGKDFRVINREGGYREAIEASLQVWDGYFDLTVVNEFTEMKVRIFPRAQLALPVEDEVTFSPLEGELLDSDAFRTGRAVQVYYLVLDLDIDREKKTVGSLRMTNRPHQFDHNQLAG